MASSHRKVKKHRQLEKIYADYAIQTAPANASADGTTVTSTPALPPVLSDDERRFIGRDLRRVGWSTLVVILLIVAVYLMRNAAWWLHFVSWLGRATHF